MKLTGAMIGSDDPKQLGEFYIRVCGKPGYQEGDWYGFDIGGGMLMIGSHSDVKGQSATPARIMISFESKDVPADFKKFVDAGAKVVAEPYNPDENNKEIFLATVADPDGNYLQLASPWDDSAK